MLRLMRWQSSPVRVSSTNFPASYQLDADCCTEFLYRIGRQNWAAQLYLSRLNHWLPRSQAYPEVVQGTTEFHHQITDALLPQADPVLHDTAALDTTGDMLDP